MRKALSILAVAIISATMVFAGGSGESSSNSLRFMWWGGDARNAATIDVINKYMEENPGIQIAAEINSDSGYIDKVAVMLSSGTAPDIMQQNVDAVPDFVSRGDFFVDLKHFFFGDALRMDFLRSGCRTDRRFGGTVQREKQRRSKRYEQSCGSLKKYSFCNGGKYKAAIWSHRNTVKFSSHNKNSYGGFLGGL